MIILGLRYLLVIFIFMAGLFFIAQNLYRRNLENYRDLAVRRKDYLYERRMTEDLQYNNMDTMSRIIRMPFGLMDYSEAHMYMEGTRQNPRLDHTTMTGTSVFWLIFTVLIIIIGFNGMVAYMSANLKFGDSEAELEEFTVPSNIMRYTCSRLQPRSAYWPVPFNLSKIELDFVRTLLYIIF